MGRYVLFIMPLPLQEQGFDHFLLNFQVLRHTIATLAQTKGTVKDVQGVLGHRNPDITANVYMQTIE